MTWCPQCVDPVKMDQIYKQLKRFSRYPVFTLRDVGRLVRSLVGKYNNEVYQVSSPVQSASFANI